MKALTRTIAHDQRGATIIEFAMIAPVMCMTLLAFFDFGHRMYVESVVEGALHEAARGASVGGIDGKTIDDFVRRRLETFSADAKIDIVKKSYGEYSRVKHPERITQDEAPKGVLDKGDCFEDANGNGTFDIDAGRDGTGGAEDVVNYEVTMTYPRIVPLGGFLNLSDNVVIRRSTPVRNQPYASRVAPAIVCTKA